MPDDDVKKAKETIDDALAEIENLRIADDAQERIAGAQKPRLERARQMLEDAATQLAAIAEKENRLDEVVEIGRRLAHLEIEGLEQARVQHKDLVEKLRRPYSVDQYIDPEAQQSIGLDLAAAREALLPTAGSVVPTSSIRTARRVNKRVDHAEKEREQEAAKELRQLLNDVPAD